MDHLLDLLTGRDPAVELDQAALDLASIEEPALDRIACLRQLDQWAAAIQARLRVGAGADEYLAAAHAVLFEEAGMQGDAVDYFHPRNSCLSQVLRSRRGLPITLSVIYLEVARRCLRPVFGLGLPSHFVCHYNDGLVSMIIDPFHGGRLLTRSECIDFVKELTQRGVIQEDNLFVSQSKRDILSRMLHNLRNSYTSRGETGKLIIVLELLLHSPAGPRLRSDVAAQLHSLRRNQATRN